MNDIRWAAPTTYGASKFEVCTDEMHSRPVAVVNTLEDARVISATIDLLEALKMVRDYVVTMKGIGHEYQQVIDAAIAKAEGQ